MAEPVSTLSLFLFRNAVVVLIMPLLLYSVWNFYEHRRRMRNLPGPPHHWFWGHLKAVGLAMKDYPGDIHGQWVALICQRKYELPSVFYLDLWPIAYQFCLTTDPAISEQVQMRPKHDSFYHFMNDFLGSRNLTTLEGSVWKKWRAVFNPGFSASHLMTLVPAMVDETQIFCNVLQKHAEEDNVFRFERVLTSLTVDIIGRVTLDIRFDQQVAGNDAYIGYLLALIDRYPSGPAYGQGYSPVYHLYTWWTRRQMSKFLSKVLRARFAHNVELAKEGSTTKKKKKNVIDLALQSYSKEHRAADAQQQSLELDPEFEKYAIDQMNAFIFAGHDTTSTVIAYTFHILSQNRLAAQTMMREHDDVFGTDLAAVPTLLKEQPHLLNNLSYTLAIIKETMRLYPVASTLRFGAADFFLHDAKTSTSHPTFSDTAIWLNSLLHHRSSANFPFPDTFLPERFLSPSSKYYSSSAPADINAHEDGAFRPFERGPRSCIGQEMALIEARVVLVMAFRRFEMRACYEARDQIKEDASKWGSSGGVDVRVLGETIYQVHKATAKPRGGMPARVRLRVRE